MHGLISVTAPARQDLTDLAQQIVSHHYNAQAALKSAAEYAMAAGDLLIQAKAELGHGRFGEWVEVNCKMSYRTARVYVQLAQNRGAVEAGMACHSDLSIRGCLNLISGSGAANLDQSGSGAANLDPEPSVRLGRPKQTTCHDIMEAWMDAPAEERARFVRSAGRDLIKHIPQDWLPTSAAAPESQKDARQLELPFADVSIPDDLSIPQFLRVKQVAGPPMSAAALHRAALGWRTE